MVTENDVIIVVPIYQNSLTENETVAYMQLVKILGNYEICFIAPQETNNNFWEGKRVERFESNYFESVESYSRLLLLRDFYGRFAGYKYMLIYQLDAFVFFDKILYFCNMGYDYYGAPWLSGLPLVSDHKMNIMHVGNGGFSLRNVPNTIRLLDRKKECVKNTSLPEDIFFSSQSEEGFKIAPLEVALDFSFETEVIKCFLRNNKKLPMGCHAWERYNFSFWKKYIEAEGYEVKLVDGNEDEKNKATYEKRYKLISFWNRSKINTGFFEEKKLYIYGLGMIGKQAISILEQSDIFIHGVIDINSTKKKDSKYHFFHTNEIYKLDKKEVFILLCVGESHKMEVFQLLSSYGFVHKENFVYYLDCM